VAHCNIGVKEDLFNASLASWKNDWLINSGATFHMNFRRDFFEEFTDNVDGVVYFANKSNSSHQGLAQSGLNCLVFHTFFCIMFYISHN